MNYENVLEKVKKILDSDAGLVISKSKKIERIIDNRLNLIKNEIDSFEQKDNEFYSQLIQLLSNYISKLYDKKINELGRIVYDEKGDEIPQDFYYFSPDEIFCLRKSNRTLADKILLYVCDILKDNKDITLDIETLKKFLNRDPRSSILTLEDSYFYRNLDFTKLANVLKKNQTLKKSNINIDDIYQLLIDTCQINNPYVVKCLVKPKDFKENHKKIDELLSWCNAKTFVDITRIITKLFDKDFDKFTILKNRKEDKFIEYVIIEFLHHYSDIEECKFIYQILTDKDIKIDYNLYYADYFGQTSLKEILALSGNKDVIKVLLSKEENIESCYWHGESKIMLYKLYAIIGDYEKALSSFLKDYNYRYDYYEDFNDDFNRCGYTYGDFRYTDSLVNFIECMCDSFEEDNIEYSKIKDTINRILNSENVKYINLEETIETIQKVLNDEDVNSIVSFLIEKHNAGNLDFIVVNVNKDSRESYNSNIIKVATDEEIQNYLEDFNKSKKNKVLSLTKKDDTKHNI